MRRPREPDEFTVQDLADLGNATKRSAANWIEKAMKNGDFTCRDWINEKGKYTKLYKRAEN